MKTFIYIAAIAANICVFSSCSENEIENAPVSNVRVEKTFGVATYSSNTRAYIYDFDKEKEGQSIRWSENDQVTVFAAGHPIGDPFSFVEYLSMKNNGKFHGKTYESDDYYVLYPAQNNARLSEDGKVQFTIPSKQKATPGSFDPEAGVQVGHAGAGSDLISLKSVVAFMSFHLMPDITYVKMIAKQDGWYLSGTVKATPKSSGGAISEFVDCSNTVELTGINGVEGDYMLAFIPSTDLRGFDFVVGSTNGIYHIPFTSGQQFNAANIYEMGTFGSTNPNLNPTPNPED